MNRARAPVAGERHVTSYRSGVMWSSLGNGLHLLAGLATMPLLTRLYGLDAYGRFGVYYGVVAVLSLVSCLRFDLAIPVQRGRLHRAALTVAGMVMGLLICGAVGIGVSIGSSFGALASIGLPLIWVTTGSGCCAAWNRMLYYQGVASHRFGLLAGARIAQALATVFAQVVTVEMGTHGVGLIIGDLIGRLVALVLLTRASGMSRRLLRPLTCRQIVGIALGNRRLVVINGLWSVMQSAAIRLPVVLVAVWWGTDTAGAFAVCHRALDAPRVLLGAALGHAWFAESARLLRTAPALLSMSYRRQAVRLALLVSPMVPLCAIWGEGLFRLVFGHEWALAGSFSSVLAVWFATRSVAWSLRQSLLAIGAQRVLIISEGALLCGLVIILGGGAWLDLPVMRTLGGYAAWAAGVQALQIFWHGRLLRQQGRR